MGYKIVWTKSAAADYKYWQEMDADKISKISKLIKNMLKTPFSGIGKPEPLRFQLTGCWSRKINHEHRLVYKVEDDDITIISCRYHY